VFPAICASATKRWSGHLMCRRNIARSFGSFATPIVATTRVYECLPTFSQLSCGKTYCQSEAMVVERHRQSITAKIVVAAALVQNATGEFLLVRKGGRTFHVASRQNRTWRDVSASA